MPALNHDVKLNIAIGRYRKETNWRNGAILWSDLLEKIAVTHRTAETFAQYAASTKDRQAEIKDIGGFVGGRIVGATRRKTGSVLERSILTLDLDTANADFWQVFQIFFGYAAAIYSTHKHSPEAPRFRLLLPLAQPTTAEKYPALGRALAGMLGINQFDPSGFQVERLMYWPSTSIDAEYIFHYQDGPLLDPETFLASAYTDWRDVSQWPICASESHAVIREMGRLGNPTEKTGLVGAFCRAYDIHEAIATYLAQVYESAGNNRYTYMAGSSAGGLVVYDDMFAYSHHGTDPAGGKLSNAFDLVRLHLHGLQDDNTPADRPITEHPSYIAMLDTASSDPEVRRVLAAERAIATAADFVETFDFADLVSGKTTGDDWESKLEVTKKDGRPLPTIHNVVTILENDPALKGKFSYNAFEQRELVTGHLPWRRLEPDTGYFTDADDAALRLYFERRYQINGKDKIYDGMAIVFQRHSFHPVREYLARTDWDSKPRLDTLLIDYLGCQDSAYMRAITRKTFTAAVARVMQPGIKYQTVLVIVGAQGLGKSTLINKMGGPWFSDSFTTFVNKESYEQIQGVWIMELGELAAMKKAEVEAVKVYVAKESDRYRAAYGRRTETRKRQVIFIGTTNISGFLRDLTGNRRFWPATANKELATKNVFTLSEAEIAQIWAEAVARYKEGEPLYLGPAIERDAADVQGQHMEEDSRIGMIARFLDTPVPANWKEMGIYDRRAYLAGEIVAEGDTSGRDKVCVAELFIELFGGQLKDMTTYNTKDLHAIMRSMPGWEPCAAMVRFPRYGPQRAYQRVKNLFG